MLTRTLFLISFILVSVFLLTGAWTGSFTSTLPNTETSFIPQTVPLECHIVGSGIDALQLLHKAIDALSGERAPWLRTKIRQTMTDTNSNFIAEGFLQCGPNHCARLEMEIFTSGKQGRLLVVSDGEVIAQVRELPGTLTAVVVERISPPSEEAPKNNPAAKDDLLGKHSCGGPSALLKQLQQSVRNAKLQTGLLDDRQVIQIKGDLSADAATVCACTPILARTAYIYLDAKTLWPYRLEWWGVDKRHGTRPILRMEFLDPQINQALSSEECVRLFSYQPKTDDARYTSSGHE